MVCSLDYCSEHVNSCLMLDDGLVIIITRNTNLHEEESNEKVGFSGKLEQRKNDFSI